MCASAARFSAKETIRQGAKNVAFQHQRSYPVNMTESPTLDQLFETARGNTLEEVHESHERWDAVRGLQELALPLVYQRAVGLCQSADPLERLCGVDILAQFGVTYTTANPHAAEICALLRDMIETETTHEVICGILSAFGHLSHPAAIPHLITHALSPNGAIRDHVVIALGRFRQDEAVTQCLIALSNDPVVTVRDWATLALADVKGPDYPGVIEALRARANDPDPVTREQARDGLIVRGLRP